MALILLDGIRASTEPRAVQNRHTVTAILERNGIEQRNHTAKISEDEVAEAKGLHTEEGWSVNALAHRYGISPKTMKSRLGL